MANQDLPTLDWLDKRRRIIEVATRLFADEAFDSISLKNIADVVGLHMATLYHYFPNKRAIYEEAVKDAWRRAGSVTSSAVELDGEPAEKIENWVKAAVEFLVNDPGSKLMDRDIAALESGKAIFARDKLVKTSSMLSITELIEAVAPPVLKEITAPRLVEIFHGLMNGVVKYRNLHRELHEGRDDLDVATIEREIATIVRLILLPPGRAQAVRRRHASGG